MTTTAKQRAYIENAIATMLDKTVILNGKERVPLSPKAVDALRTLDVDKFYMYRVTMTGEPSGQSIYDADNEIASTRRTVVHMGQGRRFIERLLYWSDFAIIHSIRLDLLQQQSGARLRPVYDNASVPLWKGTKKGIGEAPPQRKTRSGKQADARKKQLRQRVKTLIQEGKAAEAERLKKRSIAARKGAKK